MVFAAMRSDSRKYVGRLFDDDLKEIRLFSSGKRLAFYDSPSYLSWQIHYSTWFDALAGQLSGCLEWPHCCDFCIHVVSTRLGKQRAVVIWNSFERHGSHSHLEMIPRSLCLGPSPVLCESPTSSSELFHL